YGHGQEQEDEHHDDAPRSPHSRTRAGEETGEADGDEPESDGQSECAGAVATGTGGKERLGCAGGLRRQGRGVVHSSLPSAIVLVSGSAGWPVTRSKSVCPVRAMTMASRT